MDDDETEEDPVGRPEPTEAMPGTLEKVEVLRQRAEAGVQLWHEDDAEESNAWVED